MALSTDQMVSDIRRHSAEGDFKMLATQLQNCADQIARMDLAVLNTIIECLDYRAHSLGILAALTGKLTRSDMELNWATVLQQMRSFVANFSVEQVRESSVSFCNLFHRFTELLCLRRKTLVGIPILQCAIERYRSSPSTLTAIHSDLVQLCLVAKCLKPALPFLEQEYTELLTEGGQFDVKYVLLFYYYGGMVHTCLHQYLKALLCFTVCLSTPTVAISAIMVAAYKKFVLVSLLKFGKVIALPRYCSHIIERVIKPLCGAYTELARAYSANKAGVVEKAIGKYSEAFSSDGNAGLIKRLEASLHSHSVQRLTRTFMTLSLADVSSRLGLTGADEAERCIRNMVEDGMVHAVLDQQRGMVSFIENPENYDSLTMAQLLEARLQECVALEKKLGTFDREMALDPRYVHRVMGSGVDDDIFFHDEAVM